MTPDELEELLRLRTQQRQLKRHAPNQFLADAQWIDETGREPDPRVELFVRHRAEQVLAGRARDYLLAAAEAATSRVASSRLRSLEGGYVGSAWDYANDALWVDSPSVSGSLEPDDRRTLVAFVVLAVLADEFADDGEVDSRVTRKAADA